MYLYAVELLTQNGYQQYEISNFAQPCYESRHNLKYWMLEEYAGFGPGAYSDFGGVRYGYTRDPVSYTHLRVGRGHGHGISAGGVRPKYGDHRNNKWRKPQWLRATWIRIS